MGEGFLKFKRRVAVDALVKSLIVGISFGLAAFSVLFLLFKREIIGLEPLFCVLIGVGVALLTGGGVFVLFLPSDKKLAKRLDKELVLHEKVQTMVAFEKDDADMVKLQRTDTEERLRAVSASKIRFGKIWKYIVISVLAIATFVTALVVPKKPPEEPYDPGYEMSNWQQVALENLIAYVKKSELAEEAKTYTVEQLEGLVDVLLETDKQSVMKTHVINVIVKVDGKVDAVNTYGRLKKALLASNKDSVAAFGEALVPLQDSPSVTAFADFKTFAAYAGFAEFAPAFTSGVDKILSDSKESSTDALYTAISNFSTELKEIQENLSTYTETTFTAVMEGEGGVGGLYTTAADGIHDALAEQKTNSDIAEYVITELMDIFDISADELPDLGEDEFAGGGSDDEGNNDEKDDPASGGIGKGEQLFGSDDVIYDPDKGYVTYGTVLNDYFAKVTEKLMDGEISPEMEEFIRDYYATLYNGSEKE